MTVLREHLLDTSEKAPDENCWATELKHVVGNLIDLAAKTLGTNSQRFNLNEILTTEELGARLKVPVSTIEELARKGRLPGAFRIGKHWRFDLDTLRSSLAAESKGELEKSEFIRRLE